MQNNKRYVLGNHTFDRVDDYWEAQHDMKIIDVINKELDIQDPEVAIRLYNMIRDGEIVFATAIGAEFTEHVTDVLADKSINLLDSKKTIDAAEGRVKKQRRAGVAVAVTAAVLCMVFGASQIRDVLSARRLESLAVQNREATENNAERAAIAAQNAQIISEAAALAYASQEADEFNPTKFVNEGQLTILPEFASLIVQNPDIRGWIKINDTNVDYPVLQHPADNEYNYYYLDKDFNGNPDSNGSLFLDYRSDILNPTENTIIYGHNMNSGRMFGSLKEYLNEKYFYEHKNISFKTLYEEKQYEVVAVCLTKVADIGSNEFRYYEFTDAKNEAEWAAFVENVNNLSVFSTNVALEPGDEVLTLSTCNNYTEDGRLFLVAKRVK